MTGKIGIALDGSPVTCALSTVRQAALSDLIRIVTEAGAAALGRLTCGVVGRALTGPLTGP
jgi:hypothetical protein